MRRSRPSPRPQARLNVAFYYSGWREQFRSAFAFPARDNGAVPFIRIEPAKISLAAIVAGVYDTYRRRSRPAWPATGRGQAGESSSALATK